MLKRTLHFSNPCYLSTKDEQLVFQHAETKEVRTVPIEDIGIVILEHPQISITNALLAKLVENNAAVTSCDAKHLPTGLFMPLAANTLHSLRVQAQVEASLPLKKQLWQQTIQAKISNQAALLEYYGIAIENMRYWANSVRSGDPDNYEARAAAFYWKNIFNDSETTNPQFTRDRFGQAPNNLLNYTYAILRNCVARSLVGSGLLPVLGIQHKNQYNAYCLADDVMEPYRPYADKLVKDHLESDANPQRDRIDEPKDSRSPEEGWAEVILTPKVKQHLLQLPVIDVNIEGKRSPLMVALQTTTASLAACYEGKSRKICYADLTPSPSPFGEG